MITVDKTQKCVPVKLPLGIYVVHDVIPVEDGGFRRYSKFQKASIDDMIAMRDLEDGTQLIHAKSGRVYRVQNGRVMA